MIFAVVVTQVNHFAWFMLLYQKLEVVFDAS